MSNLFVGSLVELPPWEHEDGKVFGLGDVCLGVIVSIKKVALAGEVYKVLVNGDLRTFHREDLKVWKNAKKKKAKARG